MTVEDQPFIGWNRDPEAPDRFRYWNGSDWTGHATHQAHSGGIVSMAARGHFQRRPVLDSWLFKNSVVFHTMAWLDCSVPLTRGGLRRFMEPVELRTLNQIYSMQTEE